MNALPSAHAPKPRRFTRALGRRGIRRLAGSRSPTQVSSRAGRMKCVRDGRGPRRAFDGGGDGAGDGLAGVVALCGGLGLGLCRLAAQDLQQAGHGSALAGDHLV